MMIRFLSLAMLFLTAGCGPRHFIDRQASGVTVFVDVPNAAQVLFASSVDGFRAHPTTRGPRGLWVIDDLADREFRYFFIVDGRVYTPDCRYREKDDFGAINCIYQP
jgi:hypothetical protein